VKIQLLKSSRNTYSRLKHVKFVRRELNQMAKPKYELKTYSERVL